MSDDDPGQHDGDHHLEERCQSAAYRADCVHEWLAPLLKDSAAAKRAYAFKDRVKSADDIYTKVPGRRNHEDANRKNPDELPMRFTLVFSAIALFASALFVDAAAAQTCTPPRPGLIGWWDAGAVTGTEALDLKGQNRGSMIGGVRVVADPRAPGPRQFERAFHFDGKGFIGMKNPPALQFGSGPFSLEAWFASERGEAEYPHIISKSNYPRSAPGVGYWIRLTPDGKTVEFFVGETLGAADFPRVRIAAPAGPGVWHHVVGTRDAEGVAKLYVDGDVAGSERIDRTFSIAADTPFTVGAWNERFDIRNYAFSGYITDISAYDAALGANEVRALFTAPKCRGPGLRGNGG